MRMSTDLYNDETLGQQQLVEEITLTEQTPQGVAAGVTGETRGPAAASRASFGDGAGHGFADSPVALLRHPSGIIGLWE
jgi:hypothetical protein